MLPRKYYQCRLCLGKSEFYYCLFKANLSQMIESLTSIKIKKDDTLPSSCCETCLAHVHLAYRLQQKILKSDKVLREYAELRKNCKEPQEEQQTSDTRVDTNTESEAVHNESSQLSTNEIDQTRVKEESEDNYSCGDESSNTSFTQDSTISNIDLHNSVFEIVDMTKPNADPSLLKFREMVKKGLHDKRTNNQNLECKQCNLKFEYRSSLTLHLKKHDMRTCHICHISIRTDNFKKHLDLHTASQEICEICGKVAKNKESLRGHMYYQHRPDKEVFKCKECGAEFRYRYKYNLHIKKAHTNERNYQCEVCGKKFFTATDTKKHVQMTHFKARPYVCKYCKRGYSSRYALKTHIRQHTLETPFKCEFCAAGFRQRVSLRTHLKSKHKVTDINILYGVSKMSQYMKQKLRIETNEKDTEVENTESSVITAESVEVRLECNENNENVSDINFMKNSDDSIFNDESRDDVYVPNGDPVCMYDNVT